MKGFNKLFISASKGVSPEYGNLLTRAQCTDMTSKVTGAAHVRVFLMLHASGAESRDRRPLELYLTFINRCFDGSRAIPKDLQAAATRISGWQNKKSNVIRLNWLKILSSCEYKILGRGRRGLHLSTFLCLLALLHQKSYDTIRNENELRQLATGFRRMCSAFDSVAKHSDYSSWTN